MKIASLFLSLLFLAAPLRAQPLPGDSVYHLQASTQAADGQPVAWSSLRGQPRVVSMFYTNCHLMCPLIIENAKSAQKQLSAAERKILLKENFASTGMTFFEMAISWWWPAALPTAAWPPTPCNRWLPSWPVTAGAAGLPASTACPTSS